MTRGLALILLIYSVSTDVTLHRYLVECILLLRMTTMVRSLSTPMAPLNGAWSPKVLQLGVETHQAPMLRYLEGAYALRMTPMWTTDRLWCGWNLIERTLLDGSIYFAAAFV